MATQVIADAQAIRRLGVQYQTWSEYIDGLLIKAKLAVLTPAHPEPAGPLLQERYKQRVQTDLVKVLTDASKSFYDIGTELIRLSRVYAETETLNGDDLARLERLIKAVSKTYPDYQPIPQGGPTLPELG